jgi:LysR family transcriptional regulator, cyn operon transcriptional activator
MELNHLKVFYEVAKIGRFTEAAKRLNISQSALSRSVALLEESEGVQLFERSKQGVALTPLGTEVFLRCEELFQTFSDIEGLCRGTRETCEGPLRFATTDHVTNDLLVDPIQSFRRKFPLVIPSLFTGTPDEIGHALLNTECEFGLLFSKLPLPQIESQVLRAEQMALVCHPDVWKKNKGASDEKTLKKVIQSVGYIASIGAILQSRPSRVLSELFGGMPRIGLEANSQEAQKRFCLKGGGVAYLARFMVEKDIERGRLFEIPVDHPHVFNLWVATRKGRQLSLSARTFLEHLKEEGVATAKA